MSRYLIKGYLGEFKFGLLYKMRHIKSWQRKHLLKLWRPHIERRTRTLQSPWVPKILPEWIPVSKQRRKRNRPTHSWSIHCHHRCSRTYRLHYVLDVLLAHRTNPNRRLDSCTRFKTQPPIQATASRLNCALFYFVSDKLHVFIALHTKELNWLAMKVVWYCGENNG